MRVHHLLITISALALLAGCSVATSAPSLAPQAALIDGASIVGTRKTISDHFVSFMSGKDCSTVRRNRGQTYCVEDEVGAQDQVFCYPTIGEVNCFSVRAPHGEDQNTIGHIPAGAGPAR